MGTVHSEIANITTRRKDVTFFIFYLQARKLDPGRLEQEPADFVLVDHSKERELPTPFEPLTLYAAGHCTNPAFLHTFASHRRDMFQT